VTEASSGVPAVDAGARWGIGGAHPPSSAGGREARSRPRAALRLSPQQPISHLRGRRRLLVAVRAAAVLLRLVEQLDLSLQELVLEVLALQVELDRAVER